MFTLTFALAWSVALEDTTVSILVENLGHDRYKVRQAAHTTLERALLSANGHRHREKLELAAKHSDCEIARRANMILDSFYSVTPSNYAAIPWIDMLPETLAERKTVIDDFLGQARMEAGSSYASDWPEYRHATYLYSRNMLRQGCPREQIVQMLDVMANQEKDYRAKRGMGQLVRE
jgi:hypothetical protein